MSLLRDPLTLRMEMHHWPHPVLRICSTPESDNRVWVVHTHCANAYAASHVNRWLKSWGPLTIDYPEPYAGLCAICMTRVEVPNVR